MGMLMKSCWSLGYLVLSSSSHFAKQVFLIKLLGSPAPQADQEEKKYQGKPILDLPKETFTLFRSQALG